MGGARPSLTCRREALSGTIETFTYNLIGADGVSEALTVTVDATPSDTTGTGLSLAVTGISGAIDGQAITGIVGGSGTSQQTGGDLYDNAIFITPGTGIGGDNVAGIDNYGLEFQTANGIYNLYDNNGTLQLIDGNGNFVENLTLASTDAPCFCAGTMITAPHGDVAVETLAAGDLVTTTDGQHRAVRWVGHRAVATRFADKLKAMPVRIKAGALGDSLPVRDLMVSPCHALLVDGVLIQAAALVNGTSIVRVGAMPETFTYYHIELADHSLVLAEGVAAETFVDNTDRMGFDNWAEHQALFGTGVEIAEMAFPRAKSARQVPSALRARLAALASREDGLAA